ncbi:response regulator transcription factor [Neptuniibacter halophilus]|uniref:response regulator transcription factor n=1 Tax=Neptuniibacter halophilus TaxID=651666 RepID=UPI002572F39C|nr:helix-turn-helix transcriptional regulator [Neptuniibacter halophilus]
MESLILQLKQQPDFKEAPVLAVECTWDKLLKELDELLNQLDFPYFTYSVLTRKPVANTLSSESYRQRWENGSDIIGSLPDSVVKAYYSDVVQHDLIWDYLPGITKPFLADDMAGGQGSYAETFWQKQGVNSRVFIPVPGNADAYWFHYFGLYHKLPADEFREFFSRVSEWLVPILCRYHALLQAVAEKPQNPYLTQEILSPTCLHIIRMTAHGMPVKSIADKLALTEEGITYHITRAKKLFGARNKTQLISIMYEVGLF